MKRILKLTKEYEDLVIAGLCGSGIAVKKGIPCLCSSLKNCRGCDFSKGELPCDKALFNWLTETERKNGKEKGEKSAKAVKKATKKPEKPAKKAPLPKTDKSFSCQKECLAGTSGKKKTSSKESEEQLTLKIPKIKKGTKESVPKKAKGSKDKDTAKKGKGKVKGA